MPNITTNHAITYTKSSKLQKQLRLRLLPSFPVQIINSTRVRDLGKWQWKLFEISLISWGSDPAAWTEITFLEDLIDLRSISNKTKLTGTELYKANTI